jgi:hypothetical protein
MIEETPSYSNFDAARVEYGISLTQTNATWEEFERGKVFALQRSTLVRA